MWQKKKKNQNLHRKYKFANNALLKKEHMGCLQMTVVQCQILIDKLFSSQG